MPVLQRSDHLAAFPASPCQVRVSFRKFGLLNDGRLAVLTSLRESAARPSSLRVALRRAEGRTLVKACDPSTRCSPAPSSSSAANLVLHENAAACELSSLSFEHTTWSIHRVRRAGRNFDVLTVATQSGSCRPQARLDVHATSTRCHPNVSMLDVSKRRFRPRAPLSDAWQGVRAGRHSQRIFEQPCASKLSQTSDFQYDILRCTWISHVALPVSGARWSSWLQVPTTHSTLLEVTQESLPIFRLRSRSRACLGCLCRRDCSPRRYGPEEAQLRAKHNRGRRDEARARWDARRASKFTAALDSTRATFPHEHITKAHAGRASSLPKLQEPFLISPRRPRRESRLPAEKLRCARSRLCCSINRSTRSLVLLGIQKGRVHCRFALAESPTVDRSLSSHPGPDSIRRLQSPHVETTAGTSFLCCVLYAISFKTKRHI